MSLLTGMNFLTGVMKQIIYPQNDIQKKQENFSNPQTLTVHIDMNPVIHFGQTSVSERGYALIDVTFWSSIC